MERNCWQGSGETIQESVTWSWSRWAISQSRFFFRQHFFKHGWIKSWATGTKPFWILGILHRKVFARDFAPAEDNAQYRCFAVQVKFYYFHLFLCIFLITLIIWDNSRTHIAKSFWANITLTTSIWNKKVLQLCCQGKIDPFSKWLFWPIQKGKVQWNFLS